MGLYRRCSSYPEPPFSPPFPWMTTPPEACLVFSTETSASRGRDLQRDLFRVSRTDVSVRIISPPRATNRPLFSPLTLALGGFQENHSTRHDTLRCEARFTAERCRYVCHRDSLFEIKVMLSMRGIPLRPNAIANHASRRRATLSQTGKVLTGTTSRPGPAWPWRP